MEAARQIKARFEGIFASLAEPVLWTDARRDPEAVELQGYLTKGSGKDAGPEFRFREPVPGLQSGALLALRSDAQRWRVTSLRSEDLEDTVLFIAARVESLEAAPAQALAETLDSILATLNETLAASTLAPLEREDAQEALARLPRLCATPQDPAHAARIKARLTLLKDRFKACEQSSHRALGLLLKLEAQLKRQGLP